MGRRKSPANQNRLRPRFVSHAKAHTTNRFAGSGAVLLHRKANGSVGKAVLSDANDKLMAVHQAVRDHVEELLACLNEMPLDDWQSVLRSP